MSELPKIDESYKEFSNIEENLMYIEKAVLSEFSEEAIKDVQGQMIQYNEEKKRDEEFRIHILQEKAKIDEGTNNSFITRIVSRTPLPYELNMLIL